MSLPDTIFIFALALIIFGPKKLPEIGRQIGKLVGEFRRASNEFKFQIEEELRQVDLAEKRSPQPSIAKPVSESVQSLNPPDSPPLLDAPQDPADNIPVGQYPNIASIDSSELAPAEIPSFGWNGSSPQPESPEAYREKVGNEVSLDSAPPISVTEAAGSQPRTNAPFVFSTPDSAPLPQSAPEPSSEIAAHSNHHSASTEAEVTHG